MLCRVPIRQVRDQEVDAGPGGQRVVTGSELLRGRAGYSDLYFGRRRIRSQAHECGGKRRRVRRKGGIIRPLIKRRREGGWERRWPIEEESASQPSGLDGSRKVVTFQMVCIPRVTCEVKVGLHHQAVTHTTIVV